MSCNPLFWGRLKRFALGEAENNFGEAENVFVDNKDENEEKELLRQAIALSEENDEEELLRQAIALSLEDWEWSYEKHLL